MTTLKNRILEISRQNQTDDLSPWFDKKLNEYIETGYFPSEERLETISSALIVDLKAYRVQAKINTVVLGMSGGVDSALTAALFKNAGWRVIGVTMPIHQDEAETERGIEACKAIGIEHEHIDLSEAFDALAHTQALLDPALDYHDETATKIRRGNIRARLRMITLYNLASVNGGLVASTDNFSELSVGFWTLHGDVGDLSPIQSLTKSWEVPMLAKMNGVPEATWKAKPTDGLGVDDGDEAQFGFTYLELDIMLEAMGSTLTNGWVCDTLEDKNGDITMDMLAAFLNVSGDEHAEAVFNGVSGRVGSTWFKRKNPVNLRHPLGQNRYGSLDAIDNDLFVPRVVKG